MSNDHTKKREEMPEGTAEELEDFTAEDWKAIEALPEEQQKMLKALSEDERKHLKAHLKEEAERSARMAEALRNIAQSERSNDHLIGMLAHVAAGELPVKEEWLKPTDKEDDSTFLHMLASLDQLPLIAEQFPEDDSLTINDMAKTKDKANDSILHAATRYGHIEKFDQVIKRPRRLPAQRFFEENDKGETVAEMVLKNDKTDLFIDYVSKKDQGAFLHALQNKGAAENLYSENDSFLKAMEKAATLNLPLVNNYKKNAPEDWKSPERMARLNKMAHRLRAKTANQLKLSHLKNKKKGL